MWQTLFDIITFSLPIYSTNKLNHQDFDTYVIVGSKLEDSLGTSNKNENDELTNLLNELKSFKQVNNFFFTKLFEFI